VVIEYLYLGSWHDEVFSADTFKIMRYKRNRRHVVIGQPRGPWYMSEYDSPGDNFSSYQYHDDVVRAEYRREGDCLRVYIKASYRTDALPTCLKLIRGANACVVRRPTRHAYELNSDWQQEWRMARIQDGILELGGLCCGTRHKLIFKQPWRLKSCAAVFDHTVLHFESEASGAQRGTQSEAQSGTESALVYHREKFGFCQVRNLFPDMPSSRCKIGLPSPVRKVLGISNIWKDAKWTIAVGLVMKDGTCLLRTLYLDAE
jgi:hypothetical protein